VTVFSENGSGFLPCCRKCLIGSWVLRCEYLNSLQAVGQGAGSLCASLVSPQSTDPRICMYASERAMCCSTALVLLVLIVCRGAACCPAAIV
jgi:hypothetical protein